MNTDVYVVYPHYIQCKHKHVLYLHRYCCVSRHTCCVPIDTTYNRCFTGDSVAYLITEIMVETKTMNTFWYERKLSNIIGNCKHSLYNICYYSLMLRLTGAAEAI